jgi:hypothetical protein
MDTKLFFGTAVFAGQNQVFECAFESSVKCNFGFSTEKSNELNEVVITKGAAKLIVGC